MGLLTVCTCSVLYSYVQCYAVMVVYDDCAEGHLYSPALVPLYCIPFRAKDNYVPINCFRVFLLFQLTNPLPDISVAKALQLLGWAAACGDITLAQDPTSIHQHLVRVRARATRICT